MPWEIDSRVGEKLKYEPTINVSLLNALKGMVRAFGIEGTPEKDRNAAFDEAFEVLWKVEGPKLRWNVFADHADRFSMADRFGLKNNLNTGGRAETLKDATASDTPLSQADGPDNSKGQSA